MIRGLLKRLLNAGVTDGMSFKSMVQLRAMNAGLGVGIVLSLLATGLALDSWPFTIRLLCMSGLLLASLILNLAHRLTLSRSLIIMGLLVWLTECSISFGPSLGIENYFFVVLAAMVLFVPKNLGRIVHTVSITLLYLGVKLWQQSHLPYYPLPALHQVLYIIAITNSCLLCAFLYWNLLRDMGEYQNTILRGKETLRSSNELRDKMLSIIGHDLRSPLNSLKGSLTLLESDQLTPEEQTLVIHELNERLEKSTEVLNSLLAWSSQNYFTSSSSMVKHEVPLDIHKMAEHVLEFYHDAAQKKNVNLENHVPFGTQVIGDHDQILFILRNLVGNALKFSYNDGNARVLVSIAHSNGMTEISVSDNGTGMKEDIRKNLFNLDKRHTTAGTMNEKGTGLGLIFCKEFIENHGSKMQVDSTPGKGSTFRFSLKTAHNTVSYKAKPVAQ